MADTESRTIVVALGGHAEARSTEGGFVIGLFADEEGSSDSISLGPDDEIDR